MSSEHGLCSLLNSVEMTKNDNMVSSSQAGFREVSREY